MSPRVRIRHKDVRQRTPNTPARDVGEEQSARGRYFEADCLASDTIGDFVYITGAAVSGFLQVSKVDITNPAHFPCIGLITEKGSATRCFVTRFGVVDASVFAPAIPFPQSKYWIGFDSRIVGSLPVPVAGVAVAQLVGLAVSTSEIMLLEGSQPFKLRR